MFQSESLEHACIFSRLTISVFVGLEVAFGSVNRAVLWRRFHQKLCHSNLIHFFLDKTEFMFIDIFQPS